MKLPATRMHRGISWRSSSASKTTQTIQNPPEPQQCRQNAARQQRESFWLSSTTFLRSHSQRREPGRAWLNQGISVADVWPVCRHLKCLCSRPAPCQHSDSSPTGSLSCLPCSVLFLMECCRLSGSAGLLLGCVIRIAGMAAGMLHLNWTCWQRGGKGQNTASRGIVDSREDAEVEFVIKKYINNICIYIYMRVHVHAGLEMS